MSETIVGLIANPASGRDIRRLVAHGTVFDNQEKVSIVRRILLACDAAGVDRVVYMPDYYGIVEKARAGMRGDRDFRVRLEAVSMTLTGLAEDTSTAARLMRRRGLGCIVTLGGDGTNRLVAQMAEDIPLLPVSTGTNNVFPEMVEGSIAGLAAAVVAGGHTMDDAVYRAKKLVVTKNGRTVDSALIDAVALDGRFIGAKALWETENLRQAVLTRGEPHNIGMASIAGCLTPVSARAPEGVAMTFAASRPNLFAPIAPGLFLPVGVADCLRVPLGTVVPIAETPCVLALDGEREVSFARGDAGAIRLEADGPLVVDVRSALEGAVRRGFFTNPDRVRRLSPRI